MRLFEQLVGPLRHSPVTTRYPPTRPALPSVVRGRPQRLDGRCGNEQTCIDVCPAGAIAAAGNGWTLDYGRCVFCGECSRACAYGAIATTPGFELAARDRRSLHVGGDHTEAAQSEAERLVQEIRRRLGRSLHVRHLDSGSCNGCDWEITTLTGPVYDIQRLSIDFVASPRHADLLLVTGTMTRNLQEAARMTYEAMPEPRLVVATGACAISGGVFAGSYAGTAGTDSILPVDVYIPGCPPRPEAIIHGLLTAVGRMAPWRGDTTPAQ